MLSEKMVLTVMDVLQKEMRQGLSRHESERKLTSLQMENTYVRYLLDGKGAALPHVSDNVCSADAQQLRLVRFGGHGLHKQRTLNFVCRKWRFSCIGPRRYKFPSSSLQNEGRALREHQQKLQRPNPQTPRTLHWGEWSVSAVSATSS